MTGERVFFKPSADPADRSPGEPRAERERSEGRRLLCDVIRPIMWDGERGVVEAIRARTNRELRRIPLDLLEEALGNLLRDAREKGG